MKRIAVTGGRNFDDAKVVRNALSDVYAKVGPFVMVNGWCNCEESDRNYGHGADYHAAMWARLVSGVTGSVEVEPWPADWSKGRGAGPARNKAMVESGLDGCIAFPGGSGTNNMVEACRAAGVPVWDLRGAR